jgi:hypothetical protein
MGALRERVEQALDEAREADPISREAKAVGGDLVITAEDMIMLLYRRIEALHDALLHVADELDRATGHDEPADT